MYSQERYIPFSEARKAMASIEHADEIRDSLKRCYEGRWSLDFTYGRRFVSSRNTTGSVDTVTLTDFTERRGFFGLGTSYFLNDRISIGGAIHFLLLPKKQEISSFSGSGGNGSGSGGLSINVELSGRYYFHAWGHTRPYVAVGLGRYQLVAKGGNVSFSFFSGSDEDIESLNAQLISTSISGGIRHRWAPGSMVDFNIGYTVTSKASPPIGGITSPGGINSSLSLRFILNPKKKKK